MISNEDRWNLIKNIADKHKGERPGQALFNVLYDEYPLVAEQICGSTFDPFYDDAKITLFKFKVLKLFNEMIP